MHSEADGLSGLIVDRFGGIIVMEFFSAGMYKFRATIQAVLDGIAARLAASRAESAAANPERAP